MERNVLVDKLKGYACFLVLFGHVIMGVRLAGIDIPSFFWGLEKWIWSFHVPLFMFLSGVVYRETGEWRSKGTKLKFMWHKLCGLGIPYVVFSIVYILINSVVGQTNTQSSIGDILTIWATPVAQYWFLHTLFILFCLWAALSGVINNLVLTVLMVLIGYAAPLFGVPLGSLDVVFSSAMAFGLGTCVDFKRISTAPTYVKYIVVGTHIAVGTVLVLFDVIELFAVKELMMALGIYASILLISLSDGCAPITRFLNFMNKYSFQTYLLHTIFTAGIRILLLRVGVTPWWIHVLLGTVCGIAFSVLAAVIAARFRWLNFFFFPTKYMKKARPSV